MKDSYLYCIWFYYIYCISMIVGNKQAQTSLETYFNYIQEHGKIDFPFLLVDGPQYIGKTTLVENHIKKLLEGFVEIDYKPIYDLSSLLWKKHSLKVEVPTKDQHIEIDGIHYPNLWTRDLVQRFSLAPMWSLKVMFLENIERMTIGAVNAFLKTLEEPLPNRLIVATTSNKERLLDTVLSRAFTVTCQIPAIPEVESYLDKWYSDAPEAMRLFAARFSLGRLWLARKLLDEQDDLEERVDLFEKLLTMVYDTKQKHIVGKYQIFKQFAQWWWTEQLIDACVYSLSQQKQMDLLWSWLHARQLLRSNVGEDNILFGLSLA